MIKSPALCGAFLRLQEIAACFPISSIFGIVAIGNAFNTRLGFGQGVWLCKTRPLCHVKQTNFTWMLTCLTCEECVFFARDIPRYASRPGSLGSLENSAILLP